MKPEFWGDEKLGPMRPVDRLVFLGLISMADDAGRVLDNVRAIDGFIFPETEDSAAESIEVLVESGRVERGFTASGQSVLQIVNWQHQKIDKPNLASALPPIAIVDSSSNIRRSLPAKVRDMVFKRDGGACQECGISVRRFKRDRYDSAPDVAEVDHIVAVVDGGGDDPQNLRLLCLGCNRTKAGDALRRRNGTLVADLSPTPRRNTGIDSTPHINDLRSTTNDLLPTISNRRSADTSEEPPGFADWWDLYPRRSGANPRARAAEAYRARMAEGATQESLLVAVRKYAAWCEATGKIKTEMVQQAVSFLGPKKRGFEESWDLPAGDRWTVGHDDDDFFTARKV